MSNLLPIGTIADWIVGAPGPDIDQCLVIGHDGDKHVIRFQVWGHGEWHEETISAPLWVSKKDALGNDLRDGVWTHRNITDSYRSERERLGLDKPEGSL